MITRENKLRAARFDLPESIPVSMGIGNSCWSHYGREALWDLMTAHPLLFPNFVRPDSDWSPNFKPFRRSGEPYTDSWGCVWQTDVDGVTGGVTEHAISDWSDFHSFVPPSPEHHDGWEPVNWAEKRASLATARENGNLASGSLRHGHTFLTLTYIRGYENTIFDMADSDPNLISLLELIENFNAGLVQRYIDAGVEWMGYPEDLGMQQGPMLSPDFFRRYIKPIYQRLIAPARDAGAVIHMHSDGDVRALCEDIVDVGVNVINLQDLVNGVDWIRDHLKGRICIDLDLDRQHITRFGTANEISDHIERAVETLADPSGGLMLTFGLLPGAPLENVEAVMDAMEKASGYYQHRTYHRQQEPSCYQQ